MLRPADGAAVVALHVEQADVAHALEVRTHGVDVEPERLGDVGGGQRSCRSRQLEVDRVAGVVAERLQQIESRSVGTHPRNATP